MNGFSPRTTQALPIVLAVLLAALALHPVLSVGFNGDDMAVLNRIIRPRSGLELLGREPDFYHYYPIAFAYWKAQDLVFGPSPAAWHLLSLGLYLLAVVLCGLVLRRILPSDLESGVGVVLFASFFANYEPVVYLVTSNYVLSLVLLLVALLLYPTGVMPTVRIRYVASVAAATLAWLTFEQALVFLPLIVLLEYLEGGPTAAIGRWRRYLVPWMLGAMYVGVWFLGAGVVLEAPPSITDMVKKGLTGLAYMSSLNLPNMLEAYFGGPYALRVVATLLLVGLWIRGLVLGSRSVQVMVLWAALAFLPTLVLRGHHPRYFLFTSVPVAALWSIAVCRLDRLMPGAIASEHRASRRWITLACTCVLAASGVVFQRDRIDEWQRASVVMETFRDASEEALTGAVPPSRVAIVDAPAMSGPYDDVRWPAMLFLAAFNDGSVFALTPPFVVPADLRLWQTGAVDDSRPMVAEAVVDSSAIQAFVDDNGVVFQFTPDLSLHVLRRPGH
ncbi:MAG: hypothetical protein ACYC6F_08615 [Longimicrobiales bacterium]